MRWSGDYHVRIRQRKYVNWFAWYPVRIDDDWVWLETVRRAHVCGEEICYYIYETLDT